MNRVKLIFVPVLLIIMSTQLINWFYWISCEEISFLSLFHENIR